jgi:predicted HAD superfamily phosphohydrolase YqeG
MKNIFWTDWGAIQNEHIRNHTVLLDIDGVVMADGEEELDQATLPYIQKLIAHNDVWLVSNSRRAGRTPRVADILGVPWANTALRKPDPRILKYIQASNDKPFLVIGDKFLTDGLFAITIKASGRILKQRLRSKKDRPLAVFAYTLDDLVSGFLKLWYSR